MTSGGQIAHVSVKVRVKWPVLMPPRALRGEPETSRAICVVLEVALAHQRLDVLPHAGSADGEPGPQLIEGRGVPEERDVRGDVVQDLGLPACQGRGL